MDTNINYASNLPNHSSATTLGILSIVLAFCCSIVGVILGIIGFMQSNNSINLYESDPDSYSSESYAKMKTAKTLNLVGIIAAVVLTVVSFLFMPDFGELMEQIQEMQDM